LFDFTHKADQVVMFGKQQHGKTGIKL